MFIFPLSAAATICNGQMGVVPILAQAGTALFPLLALAVGSVFGLIMNPRLLLRLAIAKPWIPVTTMACVAALWWAWDHLISPQRTEAGMPGQAQDGSRTAPNPAQPDWARVALEIIHDEQVERRRTIGQAAPPPVGGATVTVVAVPQATPTAPGEQHSVGQALWFRGGAGRSGHLGGSAPRELVPRWSYFPQDDHNCMVLSSPIIRDGKVYAASCLLDPPTSVGSIFRLDLSTGRPDWVTESAHGKEFLGFFSSPAITSDGSRLIIGQGLHMDFDSALVCLDTATGAVVWTAPTPLHIEGSPAIEGDVVVVGAGAVEVGKDHKPSGDVTGRGNPGFVMGVRISTGEVIFRTPVVDPESSPVLKDGICYIGSGMNGAQVVALRATLTDAELLARKLDRRVWQSELPFPGTGAVSMSQDLILIGCGKGDFVFADAHPEGFVVALDAASGAERWRVHMPDAVLAPVAIVDALGIVPCRSGDIIAIDIAHQGREAWRSRLSDHAPALAGAACTGDTVYAVSNDGYLVELDAKDGHRLARAYLNTEGKPGELGLCVSSPLVSDNALLVGSETGGLRCFVGK